MIYTIKLKSRCLCDWFSLSVWLNIENILWHVSVPTYFTVWLPRIRHFQWFPSLEMGPIDNDTKAVFFCIRTTDSSLSCFTATWNVVSVEKKKVIYIYKQLLKKLIIIIINPLAGYLLQVVLLPLVIRCAGQPGMWSPVSTLPKA